MDHSYNLDVTLVAIGTAVGGNRDGYNILKSTFDPTFKPSELEVERQQTKTRATLDSGSSRRGG